MALLSYEQEDERAEDEAAFSNGFEGESWMHIWCEACRHEEDCPLIMVALMGKRPAAWEQRVPSSLNRYTCHEFEQKEDQ